MTSGSTGAGRPELLDVFGGAQGSGVGYARAGFRVTSVDREPHARHPEVAEVIEADALDVLMDEQFLARFDVVHTGPPCQGYSSMTADHSQHPRLIRPVRRCLQTWGGIYVIENVVGARWDMDHPVQLCGQALGLEVRRHRLFESNAYLFGTPCRHPRGVVPIGVYGEHPDAITHVRPSGTSRGVRARTLAEGQEAMGIDWMDWGDLTEAIPPAYTHYLGEQLLDRLGALGG